MLQSTPSNQVESGDTYLGPIYGLNVSYKLQSESLTTLKVSLEMGSKEAKCLIFYDIVEIQIPNAFRIQVL